jgi:hypothetical protein
MKTLINELLATYDKYDEFKRQLENYHHFVQSENGKFVYDVLKTCQAGVVNELLSLRFTKLTPGKKDVEQQVIYQLNQIFTFLMAPMRVVNEKKRKKFLMGAATPNPTRKGKKNG